MYVYMYMYMFFHTYSRQPEIVSLNKSLERVLVLDTNKVTILVTLQC